MQTEKQVFIAPTGPYQVNVLGESVASIFRLMSRDIALLIVLAFCFATPLAHVLFSEAKKVRATIHNRKGCNYG